MKKYNNLGELLVDFRKHRSLSQLDFAAMMDVDARTVIRWEKNVSLIKVEKEKILTETFRIPHQVIRNLNTDKPISILFDFNKWAYALSDFTAFIPSVRDFKFDKEYETDSIKTLVTDEDFEFVTYIQKNQKNCEPVKKDVLKLAARLLPELNVVMFGSSGYHGGHISFLPLKYESYKQLYNRYIHENELTVNDLCRDKTEVPRVFYFYSLYANSHDHAHYLMNRLLRYFKLQHFKDYIFAGISFRETEVDKYKEMSLDIIWEEKRKDCHATASFISGTLDKYLFEKE